MHILVNGERTQVPDRFSMGSLIEKLDLAGQRVAVEVNEELVPRSTFGDYQLQENDTVEIIHAVGGG